jgi:hypothetical protein
VRHVALVLATFANGKTGTSIRPGHELVAERTGFHLDTVRDAIRWLKERGELREDKPGHRGSAACYTWLGGMVGADTPPIDGKVGSHAAKGGVSHPTHLPDHEDHPRSARFARSAGADRPERESGGPDCDHVRCQGLDRCRFA